MYSEAGEDGHGAGGTEANACNSPTLLPTYTRGGGDDYFKLTLMKTRTSVQFDRELSYCHFKGQHAEV